jgi:hypothetical protein
MVRDYLKDAVLCFRDGKVLAGFVMLVMFPVVAFICMMTGLNDG